MRVLYPVQCVTFCSVFSVSYVLMAERHKLFPLCLSVLAMLEHCCSACFFNNHFNELFLMLFPSAGRSINASFHISTSRVQRAPPRVHPFQHTHTDPRHDFLLSSPRVRNMQFFLIMPYLIQALQVKATWFVF